MCEQTLIRELRAGFRHLAAFPVLSVLSMVAFAACICNGCHAGGLAAAALASARHHCLSDAFFHPCFSLLSIDSCMYCGAGPVGKLCKIEDRWAGFQIASTAFLSLIGQTLFQRNLNFYLINPHTRSRVRMQATWAFSPATTASRICSTSTAHGKGESQRKDSFAARVQHLWSDVAMTFVTPAVHAHKTASAS